MGISVSLLVLVSLITIVFNCAGLFGNFNIIIALIRKPALRSKAGYLMGLLCCFQSFCLLFELSNIRIYWSEMIMGKGVCFRVVYPHLFCMVAQSLMYFIITLDMLIAISAPLRHKMWPKVPYVIVMCAPPTMFASTAWIGSYFYIGEGSFYSCRLLTAVFHDVVMLFIFILIAANTAAVIMVFSLVLVVRSREKKMRESKHRRTSSSASFYLHTKERCLSGCDRKCFPDGFRGLGEEYCTSSSGDFLAGFLRKSWHSVVTKIKLLFLKRAVSIMVTIFACTWYLCVVSVYVALKLKIQGIYMNYVMTFNMVLAFVAYSQNYYVLWFRSPQYRAAFEEQLRWMKSCCLLSNNGNIATGISVDSSRSKCACESIAFSNKD
ncbi:hypothetical protein RB195_015044 [Necator americanus]|uniref:G-protein coupled receptors family 1 profile domain-containing protein n=1 Tax=Necator americanus TaxID=51031 RepID=A0ABR1E381_NECAM